MVADKIQRELAEREEILVRNFSRDVGALRKEFTEDVRMINTRFTQNTQRVTLLQQRLGKIRGEDVVDTALVYKN